MGGVIPSADDAAHAHPEQPLTVDAAQRNMQQHLKCHAVESSRKSNAYSFLVRAGKIVPRSIPRASEQPPA
ncbi:hypothetical protein ACWDXV_30440 [Nocardia nova]